MNTHPLNNSTSFTDLADSTRLDDIIAYARDAASDIIADASANLTAPDRLAQSISSDLLESSCFTDLPIDPELLCALISAILCDRLDCSDSDLAADF